MSTNPTIMSIQYLQVFEGDRFRQRFTQSAKICVWSSNTPVHAHAVLTMPSFIHPSQFVWWLIVWFLARMRPRPGFAFIVKKKEKKERLSRRDKVEVDVESSECVSASTAALGCLMLFKSGLRKSQSCCWQSQFSAPGVSVAPGHETHRIYAWDKEGGIHEARWSASDTVPRSDLGNGR